MGKIKLLELKPFDSYVLGGLRNFQAGTDTYRETQPLPDIMKFFHLTDITKVRFCGVFIKEITTEDENFYIPVPADILQPRKGQSGNLKLSLLKKVGEYPLNETIMDIKTDYLPYIEAKNPKYEGAQGFIEIDFLKSYFTQGILQENLKTCHLKSLTDFIKSELKIGLKLDFNKFTAQESYLYMTFLNRLKENIRIVALLENKSDDTPKLEGSYYFGGETRISKIKTQALDEKLEFLSEKVDILEGKLYRFYLTTHTYIGQELRIGNRLQIENLEFELIWLFNGGKEWISGFRKPAIQMLKPGSVFILKALQSGDLRRLTYIVWEDLVPVYESKNSKKIKRKKVELHNYGWNFGILTPYIGG